MNSEEKLITVLIYDKLFAGTNPYNFTYRVLGPSGIYFKYLLEWFPLPANATILEIYWRVGGPFGEWVGAAPSLISPAEIIAPAGAEWRVIIRWNDDTYTEFFLIETPQVIELTPGGTPYEDTTIDNEEDKYGTIKGLQATIRFLSSSQVSLSTFTKGGILYDDRFYVTAHIDTDKFIFKGFLLLDDMDEPYLDPRNEVVLKATDRLGTLKETDLVTFADVNPTGENRIAQYIAWCLRKTGLSLPINVVSNLRWGKGELVAADITFEASGSLINPLQLTDFFYVGQKIVISGSANNNVMATVIEVITGIGTVARVDANLVDESTVNVTIKDVANLRSWMDTLYLDAKTFEKEVGNSMSPYDALKAILGRHGFVTQDRGEWWIMNVDEYDQQPMYVTRFDSEGNFIETQPGVFYNKEIRRNTTALPSSVWFSNKQTRVTLNRPNKFTKLTWPYDYAKELLCNYDLSRGTGDAIDSTLPEQTIDMVPDCMNYLKEGAGSSTDLDQPPNGTSIGVLRKKYEYGYEKERYLVTKTGGIGRHYFKMEEVHINAKDKLSFSVDTRMDVDTAVTNMYPVHIRLVGDDGNLYDWEYDQYNNINRWVLTNPLTGWFFSPWRILRTDEDTREWKGLSAESTSAPASGKLFVRLVNGFADDEVWFSNISFSITAFINGSYAKYSGRYDKVTQPTPDGQLLPTVDDTVKISDSSNKNLKGSLLRLSGFTVIYDGDVEFVANGFNVPGNLSSIFKGKKQLMITLSDGNNGTYSVLNVLYRVLTDKTEVTLAGVFAAGADDARVSQLEFGVAGDLYNAAVFNGGAPAAEYFHPYGYLQAFSVMNQYRQVTRTIRANVHGLTSSEVDTYNRCAAPGLLHKYILGDSSEHAQQKWFMLLSFKRDWKRCNWTGALKEVYNITTGKAYSDSYERKYSTK